MTFIIRGISTVMTVSRDQGTQKHRGWASARRRSGWLPEASRNVPVIFRGALCWSADGGDGRRAGDPVARVVAECSPFFFGGASPVL